MVEMDEEAPRNKKRSRLTSTTDVGDASSSQPTKKTGRRLDSVWKHAEKLESGFMCKYCGTKYSGGATRIKTHLGLIIKGGIKPCKKFKKRKKKKKNKRKRRRTSSIVQEGTDNAEIAVSPEGERHSDDADIPVSPEEERHYDDGDSALSPGGERQSHDDVDMIRSLQGERQSDVSPEPPSDLTPQETPDMKEMAKNLLLSNTQYFQSHRNVFNKELESLQMEVGKYIDEVKSSWSETGLTVKIHYKSRRYHDFPEKSDIVGYTVYCPKGLLFLDINKVPNEVEEAMSTEITQVICDLYHNKDLQHVVFLASNNMFFTKSELTSFCAHERILSFLHEFCEECNWLSILLLEAKRRYRWEEIPSATTKLDHPFFELEVIMQQHKGEGEEVLADQSETSEEKFWKDGEEVLNAMGPLLKILDIFDGFVPNIGYFYEAMERAEKRIQHCKEANPEKFMVLWEEFRSLKTNLIMPIHVMAAYLNPSCTCDEAALKAKIDDDEVIQYMKEAFLNSGEEEAFDMELSKYDKKDPSLFTSQANSRMKEYHPVRWWEEFGEPFPLLRRIAIRILSQPSNCWSHFSHKPKFDAHNFEELDVLKLNLTMMNVFKELEERGEVFKPIDLCIIDGPRIN